MYNNKTPGLQACVLVIFLLFTTVTAAEEDAVIVTATRTTETVDETLSSVTVISREEIDATQTKSLVELLDARAGIDLRRNGGLGTATFLSMRGTEADHVLVLVDGVRMGSATLGTTSWEFIPVDQVDRIEIVRGPRSSLYGSDAIGGVVQIFTRKGGKEDGKTSAQAKVGYGSQNTGEFGFGFNGRRGAANYTLYASHLQTDGIDARQPVPGPFGIDEPDKDAYDNTSFSGRAGYDFSPDLNGEISLLHAEGNTNFDAVFGGNQTDFVQQAGSAKLSWDITPHYRARFLLGRSLDKSDVFRTDGTASLDRFDTRRLNASWLNDIDLGDDMLVTAGVDYLDDKVDGTVQYDESSRDDVGVFAQFQRKHHRMDLDAGARIDDNQQFGTVTTGNLGVGYGLANNVRLVGSYGTAFKAPTFNDLYFPGFSNPNLKPEKSASWELALRGTQKGGRWRVSAFGTEIRDLITFDFALQVPVNVDRADIQGLEAELSYPLGKWRLDASLTHLFKVEDATTGKQLPGRSDTSGRIDARRRHVRYEYGVTWLAQTERFDDKANTLRVPGYGIINLFGSYDVSERISVRARIENLLDKEYQTIATYNTIGRSLFLTVDFRDL